MPAIAELFESLEYGPAPEASAEAQAWLEGHARSFKLFIGGEWVEPEGGSRFETVNPATKKTLAQIAQASSADVDKAVQAARAALPAWSALGGFERAKFLYALARLVQKHSRLFAVLETMDNGKPIRETRDIDIPLVARHFYHHAGWAQLLETEFPNMQAAGVVGQVIPWNFPLLMLAWKVAPALASGCTVVLKPAEYTPLTALLFAEIALEAGLPAGVLNIVTGDGETGKAIVAHGDADKIAFTGSTEVGKSIRRVTAGSGKKLSLELGGKSPFIVFEDADVDSVVEGVVDAIWFNQGQVCCAGSKILVHESIHDVLETKLRARMDTLRVGDPLDKAVDVGAIVDKSQLERITRLVQQGVEEGGTLWQPSSACPTDGYFYPPSLFTNVSPSSTVVQEEIFGPVVVMLPFRTPDEAVGLANNTVYGLASSVWTENINLALEIAPRIKAGIVWVNSTNLMDAAAGFGGYKESGYGREGGREGMYEYLKEAKGSADGAHGRDGRKAKGTAGLEERVPEAVPLETTPVQSVSGIDRTAKLFVGGKQARPDSGYSRPVRAPDGTLLGEVGDGNRKDIRNAVEAAHAASGWGKATAHNRAQVLYYIAENLSVRGDEFARRIADMTGDGTGSRLEVEASIRTLFTYAAWADKFDGAVHSVPMRGVTLAMNEPMGVIGLICPSESPLLGFVQFIAPAIAVGNTVVAVPSSLHPLAATDFYSVLETSDVPGGVVNIVTGDSAALSKTLSEHLDVNAIWFAAHGASIEAASAGNLKRVFNLEEKDWRTLEPKVWLREATQVKNIWIPYGESLEGGAKY
jgi:aldehyde dehydrogenase (NAD+)